MSVSMDQLPWASLELRGPEVPWDDLHAVADAAAASPDVRHRLMDTLGDLLQRHIKGEEPIRDNLVDFSIPAVFALAAQRFDKAGRREVAHFLVHMLYQAGEHGEEWLEECALRAAGRLGAAMVEPALSLILDNGSEMKCWSYLCSLLELAKDSDETLRQAVVEYCRSYIRNAPDKYDRWSTIDPAVWVLRDLNDKASLPLLREIQEKAHTGDLQEAIDILEEKPEALADRPKPYWEEAVEEWLPNQLNQYRECLRAESDEGDEEFDAYDELTLGHSSASGHPLHDFLARHPRRNSHDQIVREVPKVGRNEPCPCGSGKKYKKCCA